jgi:GR25 family glycosyltransferase involved in LPS biosynthesis
MNSIIFSFCIYGTNMKYYKGLEENLKIIKNIIDTNILNTKDIKVLIGYTETTLKEFINIYKSYDFISMFLNDTNFSDMPMISRLLNIDHIKTFKEDKDEEEKKYNTYFFSRDADSRITERDLWCIKEFLKSNKSCHIIRDHYYHKKRIMGGMFGLKLNETNELNQQNELNVKDLLLEWKKNKNIKNIKSDFGLDEEFLEGEIYKKYKNDCIIHTNSVAYEGETISCIEITQLDDYDFIGNVYEFVESQNVENKNIFKPFYEYKKYFTVDHINFIWNNKQYNIVLKLFKYFDIKSLRWSNRPELLLKCYTSALILNNLEEALRILSLFKFTYVDDNIIVQSSLLFTMLRSKYKIIASFDPLREPAENEFIIQYGEYPHTYECLPRLNSRTIYRHPLYFNQVKHDTIESHKCWHKINQIYILNLIERKDRYMTLLVELCRVHAPLHKIYHYKAKKDEFLKDRKIDAYIGATKNHLDVVNHFIDNKLSYCLILEDDITFISNINRVWNHIEQIFIRPYDFDICFIAYSKYGEIKEFDDLLSLSYQDCTTSSAYILNAETANKIQECLNTGFIEMLKGGSPNIYCCDRYWKKIQKDNKMYVLTEKCAYQHVSHSDIVNNINYAFD